jgi:hypothetical protein
MKSKKSTKYNRKKRNSTKVKKIPLKKIPPETNGSQLSKFVGFEMVDPNPVEKEFYDKHGKNAEWANECPTTCPHYRMKRKQIRNINNTVISTWATGDVSCLIKSCPSKCGFSSMVETPYSKDRK